MTLAGTVSFDVVTVLIPGGGELAGKGTSVAPTSALDATPNELKEACEL